MALSFLTWSRNKSLHSFGKVTLDIGVPLPFTSTGRLWRFVEIWQHYYSWLIANNFWNLHVSFWCIKMFRIIFTVPVLFDALMFFLLTGVIDQIIIKKPRSAVQSIPAWINSQSGCFQVPQLAKISKANKKYVQLCYQLVFWFEKCCLEKN